MLKITRNSVLSDMHGAYLFSIKNELQMLLKNVFYGIFKKSNIS
jgi:hypothetical protein